MNLRHKSITDAPLLPTFPWQNNSVENDVRKFTRTYQRPYCEQVINIFIKVFNNIFEIGKNFKMSSGSYQLVDLFIARLVFFTEKYPLIFFKSCQNMTNRSKSEVTSLELQVGNNIHNSTYYNNISTPPLLFVVLCAECVWQALFESEICSTDTVNYSI